MPKRKFPPWTVVLVLAVLALLSFLVYDFLFEKPSFDPEKVAAAETRMWRAYYADNQLELGFHLIALLRNQHGLTFFKAKEIGELLASSAMAFRSAAGNYESVVLGDLTKAYQLIRQAADADFDPEGVARAELSWWVARRTPGEDSVEQVGAKMAEQYALLYSKDRDSMYPAAHLRAQAAHLRDSGGNDADWARVEQILIESYRVLAKEIERGESN